MNRALRRQFMLNKLEERYSSSNTRRLRFEYRESSGSGKNQRKRREIKEAGENREKVDQKITLRECTKRMDNVENLKNIREYLQAANECLSYLKKMGDSNAKFLSTNLQFPVSYADEKLRSTSIISHLEQFVHELENKELSFLSPKILNILPTKQNSGPQQLTSPTILSFQDEGLVPLPRVLSLISSNKCELLEWVDLFIHMTGASRRLQQLLDRFGPDLSLFRDQIQPKVQKLRDLEAKWSQLGRTFSKEQKEHMEEFGYAPMTDKQIKMAYDGKETTEERNADEFLSQLKEDQNDQLLERLIGELAHQKSPSNEPGTSRTKRQTKIAAPSAFSGNIAQGIVLNNNILSPQAFTLQLMRPRAVGTNIVEARAFIASILAPNVLLARVLYPSAFRLTLLTPHALNTYILANVLSPKVLSSRILSPDAFTVVVLSPSAGITQILSPHVLRYQVLSPTILSANFWSKNILTVEVLSPSFLSINDDFFQNGTISGTDFVKTANESIKKFPLG